jgi:hypothetical protein
MDKIDKIIAKCKIEPDESYNGYNIQWVYMADEYRGKTLLFENSDGRIISSACPELRKQDYISIFLPGVERKRDDMILHASIDNIELYIQFMIKSEIIEIISDSYYINSILKSYNIDKGPIYDFENIKDILI